MRAERSRRRRSLYVYAYVGGSLVAAIVFAVALIARFGSPVWTQVALFSAINMATLFVGRVDVPVTGIYLLHDDKPEGVKLSPGFFVLLTAAFATKPQTALFAALLPTISELVRHDDRGLLRLLFNSGQEAIYAGAASLVFFEIRSLGSLTGLTFGAALVAAVAAVVLNTVLVAGVIALDHGITWREVVQRMTWTIPHSLAFGVIALMIATAYTEFGAPAVVFLFMPLVILRFVRQAKLSLDAKREEILTTFVRAVDAKDPYTSRHSERVAAITVELSQELGVHGKELERRWYAALLHDLGKVAIPIEILTKPSSLTDSEYETIKTHSAIGADAVAKVDLLAPLADDIRHHHERLDGRGYPDRLAGDEISDSARVLAVADAFEALTSDRPYRAALSDAEALAELERTAGQQHDPLVLDALKRVTPRGIRFLKQSRVPQALPDVASNR